VPPDAPDRPGPSTVIYDWNRSADRPPIAGHRVHLLDETLRDGIQSPSVLDPNINDKIKLLNLMSELGIQHADLGLPGAGPRAYMDVLDLVNEIVRAGLPIEPGCAARTKREDIEPILDIADKTGRALEVYAFLGSSPIRQYVEGWDAQRLTQLTREAVGFATGHGLSVTFVTEDTTRSHPDTLEVLFKTAIQAGAKRICLADTVGHATPDGTINLVAFTRRVIESTGAPVEIDWHGHNDRGLGITNTIFAIEAGATRVHGTALGIGERVGNAAMELILLNLKLLDLWPSEDVSKLLLYCKVASTAMRHPIPRNYPLVGRDAFRTATGVHAAAILKAARKGDRWLADRVYSGVPAGMFGREQEIEIAHVSGESNVVAWLEQRRVPVEADLVAEVLKAAKRNTRTLSDDEVYALIADWRQRTGRDEQSGTHAPLDDDGLTYDE
jgi:2-isopropylmalate synthase